MLKKIRRAFILSFVLALVALPALAAPPPQGGDGVHFGPYTLNEDESVSGDQVIFGDVKLKENSELDGDLVVFGTVIIEEGANLIGGLAVMGKAEISGTVDGDILAAGDVALSESGHVYGDVSAVGRIDREEGAIIDGEIIPLDEEDFDWNFPVDVPGPIIERRIEMHTQPPTWLQMMRRVFRAILTVVLITLLALVIVSIWPEPTERVGEVIKTSPALAFGMGLLVFLLTFIVELILFITICLIPFALLSWLVIGLGLLMGWVAFGLILGRRILRGIFKQSEPSPLLAAVLGTAFATFVVELAGIFPLLHGLAYLLLLPLGAGAVVLTRFGMRPYATKHKPQRRLAAPPQAPSPSTPPVPRTPPAAPRAEAEAETPMEEAVEEMPEQEAETSEGLSPFGDEALEEEVSGEEASASETSEDGAEN